MDDRATRIRTACAIPFDPRRFRSVLKHPEDIDRRDGDLHRSYVEAGLGVQCVFVFTAEAYGPDADFASRMFFDTGGVREDPATGSANTAFAAYLHDLKGAEFDAVVDQGVEILRPSRLYLRVGPTPRVGGRTQMVASGTFDAGVASDS